MKRFVLSPCFAQFFIFASSLILSQGAHATDKKEGIVTFSGAISSPTCTLNASTAENIHVSCIRAGQHKELEIEAANFTHEDSIITSNVEYISDESVKKSAVMTFMYN